MQKSRRYMSYTAIQIRRLYIICGLVAVMALGVIVFMEIDDRKYRKQMNPEISIEKATRTSPLFIDIKTRYESAASELDALTMKWNNINAEYLTLQHNLSEMNKQLERVQTDNDTLKIQLADQSPLIKRASEKLASLEEKNAEFVANKAAWQKKAAQQAEQLSKVNQENVTLRNELFTARTIYDDALQQIAEWQEKYSQSQQELDRLATQQSEIAAASTADSEENDLSAQSRVRLLESKMLLIRYDISTAATLLGKTTVLLNRIPTPSTDSHKELQADVAALQAAIDKTKDQLNKHLTTP